MTEWNRKRKCIWKYGALLDWFVLEACLQLGLNFALCWFVFSIFFMDFGEWCGVFCSKLSLWEWAIWEYATNWNGAKMSDIKRGPRCIRKNNNGTCAWSVPLYRNISIFPAAVLESYLYFKDEATAKEDHKKVMAMLGIDNLRCTSKKKKWKYKYYNKELRWTLKKMKKWLEDMRIVY